VFIAGDHAEAKARVSSFIESLALRPLDVGDLKMAHWLEGAGLLMVAPALGKAVNDHDFCLGINTLGWARFPRPEGHWINAQTIGVNGGIMVAAPSAR
jgi:hypothetical protein